jgi:hypothetical protein
MRGSGSRQIDRMPLPTAAACDKGMGRDPELGNASSG